MTEPPHISGYRIVSKLGAGGAADVYEAEVVNEATGQPRNNPSRVALKVLKPEVLTQPNVVASFEYELRVMSRLDHTGILRMLDSGAQHDLVYAAMEIVDGVSLEKHLIRHQKLRVPQVLEFGAQVLEALDHVHTQGYIHRDIKPANLQLTTTGQLVLMDFGTAVKAGTKLDYEVGLYGTAAYLSPEQIRLDPDIDARADLYATGVLLYRMLAGRRPFSGLRDDVLEAHLNNEPKPASAFARVPRALDELIHKSLRKSREDRYQSARDMWADLRAVSATEDIVRPGLLGRLRR